MTASKNRSDVFIIPVSEEWTDEFDRTVRSLYLFSNQSFPPELQGTEERVWGMKDGPRNTTTFDQMEPRDWLLFYHKGAIFGGSRIGQKFRGDRYGRIIWNSPPSRLCFTVEDFELLDIPIQALRDALNYAPGFVPNGPIRPSQSALDHLLSTHRSIRGFLDRYTQSEPADTDERASDYRKPSRTTTNASRIIRNTQLVKQLKETYSHRCQICGSKRMKGSSSAYAEGHHLQPLGTPHNGPDVEENILVLCPNHHADFDYGMITVDPTTLEIDHIYEPGLCGQTLTVSSSHTVDSQFLRYHHDEIASSDF